MRSFLLLTLLAAASAVRAIVQRTGASLYHDVDSTYMPMFTEEQLRNPNIAPLDIASEKHLNEYVSRKFESNCGRVSRIVLHAPLDGLFKTIYYDAEPLNTPPAFLSYKAVVDYVDGAPTYIRLEGLVSRGVYGVRYFLKGDTAFTMVTRPDFIRSRVSNGTAYTLDLYADLDDFEEHNMVRANENSPQKIAIYYPKFNHYVEEVIAGTKKLWAYDPLSAEVCLKIMTYTYENKNFCVVRTMDWNGFIDEYLFVEGAGGYSRVSHNLKENFFIHGGSEAEGTQELDPNLITMVQVAPPTDEESDLFNSAKFIKANVREPPKRDEHWSSHTAYNASGNVETFGAAHEGYLIYRINDGQRVIWDRPGMGIKHFTHMVTLEGVELMQLTAIGDEGATYEYYMEKRKNGWAPITKSQMMELMNPSLVTSMFGEHVTIEAKDYTPEELEYINRCTTVTLDLKEIVYYAWYTDRVKIGNLITRKVLTAVDGYAFNRFVNGDEVVYNPKGKYLSTKVIHYKVKDMDLFGFDAIDKMTGKSEPHYFIKRNHLWLPVDEQSFNKTFLDMVVLTYYKQAQVADAIKEAEEAAARVDREIEEGAAKFIKDIDEAEASGTIGSLSDGAKPRRPIPKITRKPYDPYADPDEYMDLPLQQELDTHYGGHKLDRAANKEFLKKVRKHKFIRLELKGREDDRYKMHAIMGPDKTYRIVYNPAEGYLFDEVYESGVPVFATPGYIITEATIDQLPDGQHFLQIIAYDSEGNHVMLYFYKTNKYHNFKEISRATYTTLRFRSMVKTRIDVSKKNSHHRGVVKLVSKHYKKVSAFLPRYNCVIDEVRHRKYIIWRFDELNPEVVTRVVVFSRDNIQGVLLQLIDARANDVQRLYLNTNPKTDEYALFMHKGEMFALFKEYLMSRKTGIACFSSYRPNDIDWSKEIVEGSESYERIKAALTRSGRKWGKAPTLSPPTEDVEEEEPEADDELSGEPADEKAEKVEDDDSDSDDEEEEEEKKPADPDDEEDLTEEQKAAKEAAAAEAAKAAKLAAIQANLNRKADIKDSSYYVSIPFTLRKVVHKEGVVWDAGNTGSVCLDVRKYSKSQYRLVELEILTPDGRVEIRYFMNTHNGRGHYQEVELCRIGMDI
ncbi:spherical body protein 3, putative [Babesia bigemina]|uniref:Spherical body protein 3, putative n=1 Tax=Babesia bigemina TaxID=5866 RepID=A0A061DAJ7_BABBI|nr:spherical body protein 3, putative [Babesia bigemina]CDR97716.1 spherical body protein 3, putative [Babesia bigemina]|eukprot:XP_012769902.1 spherical body protein 3, putative [Babesia bigemina]